MLLLLLSVQKNYQKNPIFFFSSSTSYALNSAALLNFRNENSTKV